MTIVDLNKVRKARQLFDRARQEAQNCAINIQELSRVGVPANNPRIIEACICLRAWKAFIDGISNGKWRTGLDEANTLKRSIDPTWN
jgi:hypothetical protein